MNMDRRKPLIVLLAGLFVLIVGSITQVYAQAIGTHAPPSPCEVVVEFHLGTASIPGMLHFDVEFDGTNGFGGITTEGGVGTETTEPAIISIIAPRVFSVNDHEYMCQVSTIMTPSGANMYMINVHPPQSVMPSLGQQ
jgi:hypothetical protein